MNKLKEINVGMQSHGKKGFETIGECPDFIENLRRDYGYPSEKNPEHHYICAAKNEKIYHVEQKYQKTEDGRKNDLITVNLVNTKEYSRNGNIDEKLLAELASDYFFETKSLGFKKYKIENVMTTLKFFAETVYSGTEKFHDYIIPIDTAMENESIFTEITAQRFSDAVKKLKEGPVSERSKKQAFGTETAKDNTADESKPGKSTESEKFMLLTPSDFSDQRQISRLMENEQASLWMNYFRYIRDRYYNEAAEIRQYLVSPPPGIEGEAYELFQETITEMPQLMELLYIARFNLYNKEYKEFIDRFIYQLNESGFRLNIICFFAKNEEYHEIFTKAYCNNGRINNLLKDGGYEDFTAEYVYLGLKECKRMSHNLIEQTAKLMYEDICSNNSKRAFSFIESKTASKSKNKIMNELKKIRIRETNKNIIENIKGVFEAIAEKFIVSASSPQMVMNNAIRESEQLKTIENDA